MATDSAVRSVKASRLTHGGRHSRLYSIWWNMKARCHYDSADRRGDYKARGIKVCEEWREDFAIFRDWAMENGYSDDLTIERMDCDGNYEPSNCTWVTKAQQALNKRNNKVITAWGETKVLAEWARDQRAQVKALNISRRIREGASPEEAISHPPIKGVPSPWRQIQS